MIRDSLGDLNYWCERVAKDTAWIENANMLLSGPSKNPEYDPQFTLDISRDILRLMLRRYSLGDQPSELSQLFPGLLDAWELSNRLSDEICAKHNLKTCRDWVFDLSDLNHYIWCFWVAGLALLLKIPDDLWQRLLVLVGEEGRDVLLDRVIASRQPERVIGAELLHVKPYARLLKAIDAPEQQQAALLREFVEYWYPELNRRGKQQPWWYLYGDPEKHPLEMGSYFGRWCIEAAVSAKVFGLDDSQCLGHENYPGDLLRPDGPSTHKPRPEIKKRKWFGLFGS